MPRPQNFVAIAILTATLSLPAQTPHFEAADIHRSPTATNTQSYRSGGFLRGNRYDLRKATMIDILRLAYGFEPDTIFGGPDWLEFDGFDIAAKAPSATTPEDLRLMLQALLADRFKLAFHRDTHPMPVFALTAGQIHGMNKAPDNGNPTCEYQRQPDGLLDIVYSCRNMTMSAFAQQLRGMAGDYLLNPVIDSTHLKGAWDFDLKWPPRTRILPTGAEREPPIFEAIEQQLGLKLTPTTSPEPAIVIDRINEDPTPNLPNIAQLLPPRELQFEVASVRPCAPEVRDGYISTPSGGLDAKCETMQRLFATAWDIHWDHQDELIAGMPKWMDTARYAIQAKPPSPTSGPAPPRTSFGDDDFRLMLRNLLIDRFHIKVHYENRSVNAYTLVVAKPRLKKADPRNRANCKDAVHRVESDPREPNQRYLHLLRCQNVTLTQFADQLLALSANDFAYPVLDDTGMKGRWDILLSYTPTGDRRRPADNSSDPNGSLSIFEAISKQLGLKLEARKRDVPFLVIDHIEQQPAAN